MMDPNEGPKTEAVAQAIRREQTRARTRQVAVASKSGARYSFDESTGVMRRLDKPHRSKKERRRLRQLMLKAQGAQR